MNALTLDLYTVARTWMRFDGFDPYNTAQRLVDNMSEARHQCERSYESDAHSSEFVANRALQVRA